MKLFLPKLLLTFIGLLFCSIAANAQFTTPTIDAAFDGAGNYPNTLNSGGTNWYLTWNNTDLSVCILNANQSEPVSIFLDVDPIVPVNGGTNADGNLVGIAYDGYTGPPNLPFRADVLIYAHNGYRELFRRNGAGGWTSLGGGNDGICGGGTNDYAGNANGQYSSNDAGDGNGGNDRREFKISWARLQGAINGGARPAAFNWFGYISYNNGMYAQVPTENYNGNNVNGNNNGLVRYFTVSNTGNGTSTNPFGQNSYTHPIGVTAVTFGAISVFDFTLNSPSQSITRTTGAGGAWSITGNLVLANGTLSSGSSTNTISTNNLDIRGGTLTLSSAVGGDLNVAGNFAKTSGTFNCSARQVNFNGTGTQTYTSNATENINFLLNSKASGTLNLNSSITIPTSGNTAVFNANTTTIIGAGAILLLQEGTTMTANNAGSTITVNGTLQNSGVVGATISSTAANLIIGATGSYDHNMTRASANLGIIPTATWNTGSTCLISGLTSPSAGAWFSAGHLQTFSNFTWNCTGQTIAPNLGGSVLTVNGAFSMLSTNISELRFGTNSSGILNCSGFSQSGGTINLSAGTGSGTINCTGIFNQTGGTITETGSGTAHLIAINGASPQNLNFGGSITQTVNYNFNNATGFTLTGNITVNQGATLTRTSGSFSGAGTITYNATASNLVYAGFTAFTSSNYEFPTTNGPVSLTINTTGGLNLHASRTLPAAGILNLTSGRLTLGANSLTILNPALAAITGTFSASNMVVADGAGQLIRAVNTSTFGARTWPIGDASGDYSPVVLDFSANSTAREIGFRVVDANHPQLNTPDPQTHFISRNWPATNNAAGTYTYTGNFTYVAADINGTQASIKLNKYNGSAWAQANSSAAANVLTLATTETEATFPIDASVEYTGRVKVPSVYAWNATTGTQDFTVAANWTPSRTAPAFDDILTFPNGGSSTANNVPTQTIGQIIISGSTTIALVPSASNNTLTISGGAGADLDIPSGSSLVLGQTTGNSLTLAYSGTGHVASIAGTFTLAVNTTNFNTYITTNATTTVNGVLNNGGVVTSTAPVLVFGATGIYDHTRNGGVIATSTWNIGSLCIITGVLGTMPTGTSQTFSDFSYNCPGQTGGLNFSFTSLFSCRDFTFINSNGQNTGMISGTSAAMTINRDLIIQGGVLRATTGAGIATINLTNNFNISGGTFELSVTGAAACTINHTGNFTQSLGTIQRLAGGSATWNFRKIGVPLAYAVQNITQSGGTIAGAITFVSGVGITYSQPTLLSNFAIGASGNFTVSSGSGLDFSTFVLTGNVFTLQNGGLAVSANPAGFVASPTLSGSVQTTTRAFNLACNYAFTGTSAQVTGSAVPTNATFIFIANPFNVTLTSALTLTDGGFGAGVTFIAGHLILGANNLTLAGGAPAINAASATQHIKTNGIGRFRRIVGASPVVFPVGNTAYNPITLTNSGTSDTCGVRVIDAVTSPAPYDATYLVNRYWEVNETVAGGGSILANAQYNGGEPNANFASGIQLKMGLHNGTTWSQTNATSAGGGPFVVTNSASFSPTVATYTLGIGKDDGFIPPFLTYTWNGSSSSDWGTGANWSPVGIPNAIDDIIIPTAASYTNELIITGSRSITNLAVNGTGKYTMAASATLTVSDNYTYSSSVASTFDCTSTLTISSGVSQTIPAANYGNLDLTGGARVLANSGIIGICGTFTRGAGAYTITGSTVNYNGTGAQTIAAGTYNNLTISNARGAASLTSPAGTIAVAGVFNVSTLSAYTPSVNAASIFDFTSAGVQTIPAFFYGQLNNTGNGNRTWANTGVIDIAQGFTPTTATNTITGSTVRYSNTAATTWNLTSFTTNVANRLYHNLEFVGGASTIWQEGVAFNFGITGNLTISGLGRLNAHSNAGSISWIVDGNVIINGGGNLTINNSTGTTDFTVAGNTSISSGTLTIVASTAGALSQTFTTNDLNISGTGAWNMDAVNNTSTASVTINGNLTVTSTTANCINFGTGNSNTNNVFNLKGNFSKSGIGNIGLSGTYAASAGFIFNGVGTQTYTHSGAAMSGGIITVAAGSTLQLLSNLTTASSANTNPLTILGTLDCGSFVVSNGNAANTFTLGSTGNLLVNHASGVSSTITGFSNANTTWSAGATFTFNGTAQNTGMSGYANISSATNYNLTWLGNTSLTLDKSLSILAFNFTNNGLIDLGTFDITIPSAGSIAGAGFSSSKMFVASSSGQLRKSFTAPAAVSFTWPIGDNTAGNDYSPVTIIISAPGSGTVGFRVTDATNPNNAPAVNFLSRYWSATSTFAGAHSWNGDFTYTGADINGTEGAMKLNIWDAIALGWTEYASSSAAANVLTVTAGPALGSLTNTEITGRTDIPVYYQSVGAGGPWATASNWQIADNPAFTGAIAAVNPPNNINSAGIWIRNGSPITVGSTVTADQLTIDASATLTIGVGGNFTLANGVGTDLVIDGSFNVNNTTTTVAGSATTLNGTWTTTVVSGVLTTNGTMIVSGTGIYTNNVNGGSIPTASWNAGSKLNIQGITSSSLTGGMAQLFWDVEWNCSGQSQAINLAGSPFNTIANDLTITNTNSFDLRMFSSASAASTLNIGGDLIINGGNMALCNGGGGGSNNMTLNVTGDVNINGGTLTHSGSASPNTSGIVTINIGGNLNISAGRLDFNRSGGGSPSIIGTMITNLSGNLNITGAGTINSTTSLTVSPIFRFNKATGIQTYSASSPTTAVSASPINWEVGNGATTPTLQLSNDFVINAASTLTVQNLATLNVGTLIVRGTTAGTNGSFNLNSGSTLLTANANGIVAALGAVTGSIQTGTAKTFNSAANYTYNGTVNQATGTGLPTPHTGILRIDNSGAVVTLTTVPSTGSTLVLANGTFQIGIGQTYNISNGGTVTSTGGDFATGTLGGTLNFVGTGTFAGVTNPYNVYINGGVNFGAGANSTTIQSSGTLRINAGGFVNTSAPFYNANATLQYFTGGTYGRNLEWSAASGRGYPGHVQVSNNTTVNPGAGGNTGLVLNTAGNLTIDAGSNIYMDFGGNNMTVPLIVNGDIYLTGNLSGSGAIGGDIELKGNWNNNGAAALNFFPNSRAVTFNGSLTQNIGGSNTAINPFDFLTINNSSGVTLISYNVEVDNQLTMIAGHVTIGNFNIKLNGLNTTLTGASSSNYIITNGTGRLSRNFNNVATLYPIGPDATTYAPVTLQQSGSADDITIRVSPAPAYSFALNDNNQMVELEWIISESVLGGNNLSSNFQWPLSSEALGFIRSNGVFQGDYTGSLWQARASILSGGDPYLSSSSVNFTGNLSNRPFVIGNINGIIGCVATVASGLWSNPLTWSGGNVPPTASSACISHSVQIAGGNTNALSSLTLNVGGSLDIDATRSLIFGTGGLLTNSTGSSSTITGLGSIIFNGAGTFAGGNSITLNNAELNGLTTVSTPITVEGELWLNSGSSLSATPTYGINSTLIYNTGGVYNVNVEWTGSSVTAGLGVPNNVGIRNSTVLNMPLSDRGQSGTMSIESGTLNMGGGDLHVNGNWTRHNSLGNFNPNGKAIFFTRAGTQYISVTGGGTETFNYLVLNKASGSLVLNNIDITDVVVNGSLGNTLQIVDAGVLDVNGNSLNFTNAGGSILASGGARSIISTLANGEVNIQSSKSVTSSLGGTLDFGSNVTVSLSSGMNFGSSLSTIHGRLQIVLGGFVDSNAPIYATGSTLRYFSGSTYGRGLEWSATSGPGYPHHVDIDQNGTVTTLDLSNGGSAIRQIAGNLSLNNGGNLSMGAMSHPLIVKGNVSIGGASTGTLSLSSAAGGDIQIAGNLTRNAGGVFTQNGREVTMNGTTVQSISNNIASFDYLNIDNTGSSVQINTNTSINTRLKLTNGLYDLNGFSNTMANGSQIRRSAVTATMSAAPTINGGNVVDMQYDATMTSGVEFIQDLNKIRDLVITAGTLTIDQNKTINRDLILSGGDLDLATFTFTDRGNIASPAFAGSITVSGGGTRLITGSSGSMFDITGLGANSPLLYTKTVSTFGGTLLSFDANVLVRIGDGAVDFGAGNPTTINGVLQVLLGGSVGQILNPCYYGTNSILRFANTVDYQVGLNDKTWASGAIGSGNPGIPWNVEVNDIGTDLQLQNTRALRGNLTITNGTFTLTPAYTGVFAIGGNWTRTGASSSFAHNSKKVVFDKQIAGDQSITVNSGVSAETYFDLDFSPSSGNVVLNGNVNALNAVGLVSGKVDLNGYEFKLGTTGVNGTLTGGTSSQYFISGSVASKLIRYTTTTTTPFLFPVGDVTNYTPYTITFNAGGSLASTSQIAVNVLPNTHPNLGTSTNYINRYWSVTSTDITTNTVYGVNYQYADADVVGIEANLFPAKHNPSGWIQSYGSGALFMMGSGAVNPGTNTFNWTGINGFSDFTGNGNGSPLPISLLNFDVKPILENVEITWATASETNNDYFTLERSKDGITFKPMAEIDGAGNSNTILNYKFMDFEPYQGLSYYRLKQTDFDGKFEYSEIKSVNFIKPTEGQNWSVYPNPSALNGVNLVMGEIQSESVTLTLTDVTGKVVYDKSLTNITKGNTQFISFDQVSTGIYYLTVNDGESAKTIKIILSNKE